MAAGDQSQAMVKGVRYRLGDLGGVTWSDAEIYDYLNDAQLSLAHSIVDGGLWAVTKIGEQVLTAELSDYALPTDFLRDRLLKYKGIPARRQSVRNREVRRDNAVMVASETSPYYDIHGGKICLDVGAVTQADGEVYALWYVKQPATMSDSVDPELPSLFFNAMEDFAVSRCLEQSGVKEIARVQMGDFLEQVGLVNLRYEHEEVFDDVATDTKVS